MGDITLGAWAYKYFTLDIERPSLPHVESWYARLCERPAYQKHVMIPFGSTPEEWLELEKAGSKQLISGASSTEKSRGGCSTLGARGRLLVGRAVEIRRKRSEMVDVALSKNLVRLLVVT